MFQKDKFADLLDAPVTKIDPHSVQGLIVWLETLPPDGTYDWRFEDNCLIAQYAKAMGADDDYWTWLPAGVGTDWGSQIGLGEARPFEWTFGVALIRARAYAAQSPLQRPIA